MKREDFRVGQTVLYFDHGLGDKAKSREATVTKVGRTNVTVELWGREHAFKMDTGYAVRDFGGRIRTKEYHAELEARRLVHKALREEYGVTLVYRLSRGVSTAAWAEVLAVLDRAVGKSRGGPVDEQETTRG